MKQVLYINGDSWLASRTNRVVCNNHQLFKDFFVINQAVPGSGNMEIINNTRSALKDLKSMGIKPIVCVGLTEVGRNFKDEINLVPKKQNLTEYLEDILIRQFEILQQDLDGYNSYLFTGWTHNPLGTKSIIDFIDQDFSKFEKVYTVQNKIYKLLDLLSFINKESFVKTVDAKQQFESALLNNKYVNDTLHLEWATSDLIYEKFFSHILSTINVRDDK